ncbi:cytochrome [Pectobacterium brasiliense]|uniref:cytochrome P450 n=1 Tax=Pectobacterium brasiliense TaxID=180957 RepID=UPI0001A4341C|nr:cytochrome P450 [Pectobacterium brasiliense]KGA25851.1 cytochrome P450 [Pectobacterium brasiliense]KRF62326.1 cytochrome [Pectobacterium brasiliense]MBN3188002.1 cytochrome P450 [Pectobacterium brasiliense]QHG28582.1 cytochrome P450 [Pectobacterium brasiliense]
MRSIKRLPMPPTRSILGHVDYLKRSDVHLQMLRWKAQYGRFYRLRLGFTSAIVIADAECIRTIMKSRPDEFRRISSIESVFQEAGLNGVFSSEGKRWEHQRRLTEPMFQPAHLKYFYPSLRKVTSRLSDRFTMLAETGEAVVLVEEFKRYTVDITSLLAFGEDVNTLEQGENPLSQSLRHLFPMINARSGSLFPLWRYIRRERDKQFDASLSLIREYVDGFIYRQRKRLRLNPQLIEAPENMLQVMLAEQKKDGTLKDDDIVANAITLLLAGEDTTANTLAWMSFQLCSAPSVEECVFQECKEATDGAGALLPWPLPRLPWLTAVMYESMRLKPVAPLLYLEPTKNTVIDDFLIKKGTPLLLMLNASGFDDVLFQQPDDFVPERWLERGKASFSDLQPFGGGPRMCPGRSLALMEIKLGFHALCGGFRVEAQQPASDVTESFAFTMSPSGFRVKLHKREPLQ